MIRIFYKDMIINRLCQFFFQISMTIAQNCLLPKGKCLRPLKKYNFQYTFFPLHEDVVLERKI